MAGMFTIKATNVIRAVRTRMARKQSNLGNFSAVHLKAAIVIQAWVFRNFTAQGGKHDTPSLRWRDLAPSTKAARARKGTWPGQILAVTGTLRGGFVPSATSRSGKVENYVPYARYHEYGNRRGRPPQRKMFPAIAQARDIVRPLFLSHVKVSIK